MSNVDLSINQLPKILLVEDNPVDVDLIQESFEEAKILVQLIHAENGVEALKILQQELLPDVILLDLNMPKMNGKEFLQKIKSIKKFKKIPVVILTTSQAHRDIVMSYELQASAYLSKPVDYVEFVAMMRCFDNFYLTFVRLPRGE